jgi:hypothetical protein
MNDHDNLLWAEALERAEVAVDSDRMEAPIHVPAHILLALHRDLANARNIVKQHVAAGADHSCPAENLSTAARLLEDK